nr:hypothetical protein [Candidatus Njordarchaeota archaeon]
MGLKVEKNTLADVVDKLSKFAKGNVKDDGVMIPTVFYSVNGKEIAVLCYSPEDMHRVITLMRKSPVDWFAVATTGWMSDMKKIDPNEAPDRKRMLLIQARMGKKTYTRAYEVIKNRNRFKLKATDIPPEEKAKGYIAV